MDKKLTLKRAGLLALVLALTACGGQKVSQAQVEEAKPSKAGAVIGGGGMVPTPAEQFLIGQGAKITKAFMSESGLKAVVADNGRAKQLFYISPNGEYLMSGTVYDSVGGNVTSNDVARGGIENGGKAEALSAQARDALWRQAGMLNWIADGKGDRVVYVIFDPSCPYCHQLWTKLQVEAAKVNTQVRWIPVAILAEGSKNLVAAIYQSKNASDALHAMGDRTLNPVAVREETVAKLEGNLNLLRTSGYTGVPTIIYKDHNGVQITMDGLQQRTFEKIFN